MKTVYVPSNANLPVRIILKVLGLPVLEKCIDDVRKGLCPRGHGRLNMSYCNECLRSYYAKNVPTRPTLRVEMMSLAIELQCAVHDE